MSDGDLRAEVLELMARLLGPARVGSATTLSYQQVFQEHLGVDPLAAEPAALRAALAAAGHTAVDPDLSWAALLDLAFSLEIAPRLGRGRATYIIDYPPDQAALAALQANGLARRFELFMDGLELANGFGELTDPVEQRQRFETDLAARAKAGQRRHPLDEDFLAALATGLPDCAGVAVGFDRLVMLAGGLDHIDATLTFPYRQP